MSDQVVTAEGRVCTGCDQSKPASAFYSDSAYAGNLAARCIECMQRKTPRAKRMRENRLLAERGLKRCLACDEVKDVAEFWPKGKGLTASCGECERAKLRARHAANPEPQRERVARRQSGLWETNPAEARRRARIGTSRRRARIREAFVEDVDPQVIFERDEGICGICEEAVEREEFDVDHVIPLAHGGEHSYANTRLSHVPCNRRRGRLIALAAAEIKEGR